MRQEDKNSINKQLKYKQKFGIFQFYKSFVRNYRMARTKCPFLGTKANIFTGTFLSSFQNIYKCKFGRNKINVTNFLLTNLHFIATFVFFTMHKSISSKMILSWLWHVLYLSLLSDESKEFHSEILFCLRLFYHSQSCNIKFSLLITPKRNCIALHGTTLALIVHPAL